MSMYDKNHYNIVISLQLIKKNYLFTAVLGLQCCAVSSLVVACGGCSLAVVHGRLRVAASLVAGQGLQGRWAAVAAACCSVVVASGLQSTGSIMVVHGPSCSTVCGIILDQGVNPCLLHRQADSSPRNHHGSPHVFTSNVA